MSKLGKIGPRRGGQYLRVSLDTSGRARSNDEQQRDNERDAELEGVTMVRTYRDPDRSASRYATKAREEYEILLHDIARRDIDVLYLWEPSRGSRRVSEWVTLIDLAEAHHVQFRVTSHGRTYDPANPRDRRSLLEDAVDSEYESGKSSMRIRRAAAASALEGRPHGMVPYGYLREYHPHSGTLLQQIPDSETAPVVREIVARILAGDPLRAIADDLTRRGAPTPRQHRARRMGAAVPEAVWSRATIRTLMGSPTMAGSRVHQGQVVGPAEWEPLVSVADYELARRRLTMRGMQSNPGSAVKHLLSGIAECGPCGARLRREMNNGVPSYVCGGLPPQEGRPRPSRKHVTRAQAGLDAMVIRYVVGRLADPGLVQALVTRQTRDELAASQTAAELADLRARLSQLEESAASGGITAAAFGRIEARILDQVAAAQKRLTDTGVVSAAVLNLAGPAAGARWADSGGNVAVQRQAVRTLVRVVVHRSTVRGRHRFDASTVEIVDVVNWG